MERNASHHIGNSNVKKYNETPTGELFDSAVRAMITAQTDGRLIISSPGPSRKRATGRAFTVGDHDFDNFTTPAFLGNYTSWVLKNGTKYYYGTPWATLDIAQNADRALIKFEFWGSSTVNGGIFYNKYMRQGCRFKTLNAPVT
jgi:hypothetical protein